MDKKGHQGMSNMAGMILVSSKNALGVMTGGGGEQGRGRRSERHVSSATPPMAPGPTGRPLYVRNIAVNNLDHLNCETTK